MSSVGWPNVQSLFNKTTAVYETIDDEQLDVIVLTETWKHSSSDISIRLAAPSGFDVIDVVRESDPGHGGIAVFYRRRYRCDRVSLPTLKSFEGLCTRLSMDGVCVILMSIYRPGSSRPASVFFDELTGVLDMLVMHACPVVIGGDFNIHVEDPSGADAARLQELLASFDIAQNVKGSTHRHEIALDLIVTFVGYDA